MRSLFPRFRAFVFRRRAEQELDEELNFHIEMQTRKNRTLGMDPEQARRSARVQFGANTIAVKEYCRDVRSIVWLEQLRQDLRYACRGLAGSPGFTLLAVFALALGIGVNTTLFSTYNAVALKPLPVADPDNVVRFERWLESHTSGNLQYGFSYPEYVYCRAHGDQFSSVVAASWTFSVLASTPGSAATEQRTGQFVSANYFTDLGIPLRMGRGFLPAEDRTPGGDPVVVIGYRFWQRTFAGDPKVVGRIIQLNGAAFTVIGVTPEDFTGTTVETVVPDFQAPLSMQVQLLPGQDWLNRPEQQHFQIFARLKSLKPSPRAAAQAQADLLVRQFATTWTPRDRTVAVTLQRTTYFPNTDDIRFQALVAAVMLMVGLVLLVACANVGNMLLARGAARQREISTRMALGAGCPRVLRQLLSESILLALLGGLAGLLLSIWTTKLLGLVLERNAALIGGDFSAVNLAPDFRVLAYVLAIALASGMLFGISPALQLTRRDLTAVLKDNGESLGNMGGSKLRNLLVAAQVAVSVLLLATAGLLARGLLRARAAEPEFETRSVFTVAADFTDMGSDPLKGIARQQRLADKLRERPELSAAALGSQPFAGTWTPPIVVGAARGRTLLSYASNGYFETLGIPLLRGRSFTVQEARGNAPLAVISESAARRFWPGGEALGRTFALDMDFNGALREFEVIGIVKDVRFANLTRPDPAHVYLAPGLDAPGWVELLVRITGNRQRALADVATVVAASDQKLLPGLRLVNLDDGAVRLQRSMSHEFAMLAATLAILALSLAVVGIYGVISYLVSRRTRDIGVRMALGADSTALWKDVILQGLRPVFVGMMLGVAAAACLSTLLHQTLSFPGSMDFLYGVPFYDPVTFTSLAIFVPAVAALASAIPARRALRVDPAVALRYE
jgi:macrolide transport system ATP-binding/permease protein